MDRIIEWTAIKIDRIWSYANADWLPLPLEEEEEGRGDEDDHARSEPLSSDDMDFGH